MSYSTNQLGRTLARLRSERGWSKAELARRAGVSEAYVGRLENGKHGTPSASMLQKIADVFNIDLQVLLRTPREELSPQELQELEELRTDPELRARFVMIARSFEEMSPEGKKGMLDTLRYFASLREPKTD